jgi:branched-chain amino acid transport system ATP-binding protein
VMNICERLKVIDFGKTIAEGPPETVRNDPSVLEAYLGEQAEVL